MVRRLHSQLKTELTQKAFPGELVQTVRVECARTSGSTKFKINQEERQHTSTARSDLSAFSESSLLWSHPASRNIKLKLNRSKSFESNAYREVGLEYLISVKMKFSYPACVYLGQADMCSSCCCYR